MAVTPAPGPASLRAVEIAAADPVVVHPPVHRIEAVARSAGPLGVDDVIVRPGIGRVVGKVGSPLGVGVQACGQSREGRQPPVHALEVDGDEELLRNGQGGEAARHYHDLHSFDGPGAVDGLQCRLDAFRRADETRRGAHPGEVGVGVDGLRGIGDVGGRGVGRQTTAGPQRPRHEVGLGLGPGIRERARRRRHRKNRRQGRAPLVGGIGVAGRVERRSHDEGTA